MMKGQTAREDDCLSQKRSITLKRASGKDSFLGVKWHWRIWQCGSVISIFLLRMPMPPGFDLPHSSGLLVRLCPMPAQCMSNFVLSMIARSIAIYSTL